MSPLPNHLWQSTVFAGIAALLALTLRKNRAAVRYWVWFAASLKFLVPFALLIGVGSRVEWRPPAPAISGALVQVAEPFSVDLPAANTATVAARNRDWLPLGLLAVWALGVAVVALLRLRDWRRVRAAMRAGIPVDLALGAPVLVSPGLLEPGVVGWWRPVLLLPDGIVDRLTPRQLEAVLAHELCHVRRRDNLLSAIHMLVEALFWFHPLVWWIGARLVAERERACDEAVLDLGSEPQVYAEGILNVCKLYVESPLVCVAGVTGADLKERIEAILANRGAMHLDLRRKTALTLAALSAVAAPFVVGMIHPRAMRAQAQKFEVASIKLNKDCGQPAGAPGGSGVMKKGGGGMAPSPERIHTCGTLEELIQEAYVAYANGHLNRQGARLNRPPMAGGPAWTHSDQYVIDAKAEGAPGEGTMHGPMLRALLEERFQLQLRRETREVPAYDMTAGSGGPKVRPFQPGSCTPHDPNLPMPPPEPGGKPCMYGFRTANAAGLLTLDVQGTSFDNLARLLAVAVGRPVVNKTGIPGLFDFRAEFLPDNDTPLFEEKGDASNPGPSLFVALREQLGLKMEPSRGPREFLVIDHVERPGEN